MPIQHRPATLAPQCRTVTVRLQRATDPTAELVNLAARTCFGRDARRNDGAGAAGAYEF